MERTVLDQRGQQLPVLGQGPEIGVAGVLEGIEGFAQGVLGLGLRSVNSVVRFDEDTPQELIRALQPDVMVKGGDYTPEKVVGRELVEARGGRLVLIPFLPGHSTSRIEERIRSGRGVTLEASQD